MDSAQTEDNALRGIVLLGRNVATYKFALAGAVLELAGQGLSNISLDELAVPFASRICSHLLVAPKQATSRESKFLDACRAFNAGEIDEDHLRAVTARRGFNNVIDAFHVVGAGTSSIRFFEDARKTSVHGIVLTDSALGFDTTKSLQLASEVEARWRLVETAWDLGINTSLILYDQSKDVFTDAERRTSVASARNALNGYQKGSCFYCYRSISTSTGSSDLADVDHFFPHSLQRKGILSNLDGIWNLVLACKDCNRGPGGKFDVIPDSEYVERLRRRNDFLCESHNPLRETLWLQTGQSQIARFKHLQQVLSDATQLNPARWSTAAVAPPTF